MLHSKLTITVEKDSHFAETETHIDLAASGCKECMQEAITMLMVKDPNFREMVNRAGREANKIRRGEGGVLWPVDELPTNAPDLLTQNNRATREYTVHKREVRQRILGYINTQRGKKELYFWTVSFPQGIDDAVAYRVYNIWLTTLRQRKMLREYIWVAERQENGTIHFHIAIPHKMPVQRANAHLSTKKIF